jgi:hypothetical protein
MANLEDFKSRIEKKLIQKQEELTLVETKYRDNK